MSDDRPMTAEELKLLDRLMDEARKEREAQRERIRQYNHPVNQAARGVVSFWNTIISGGWD